MAKSKKKKQEDFQKVKLKVGKRLPKGQNVTNTSFKTRSIQVVQQIKSDSSQPSTHRKQNVTDLLNKCQHYSISVRHEGVAGLRELLASFPELMTSHLSTFIEKVLPLIMDKDNTVRQTTVKLFKFIIPNTPTNRIQPFFSIVSAHLCCAMTHIYDEIQHDSLELFDVLLESYPVLIANNSGQLLQNFIEQISRQQNLSKKGSGSNLSLAVRPDSRYSVQRWRSGVLSRVHKLLSALLSCKFSASTKEDAGNGCVNHTGSQIPQQFPTSVSNDWSNPGYIVQSSVAKSLSASNKEDNLSSFAASLIPLMIQCWIECQPHQGNRQSQGSLVHPGSVAVMHSIMGVLHLLWQCVEKEALDNMSAANPLSRVHQKEFSKHFMSHFPYCVQDTAKHRGHRKYRQTPTVSSEALNLSICEVMTNFIGTGDERISQSLSSEIGQYLLTALDMQNLSLELTRTLVSILQQFVGVCADEDTLVSVLELMVSRYLQAHPLSSEKRLYLELLTRLFLDSSLLLPSVTHLMDQFFQSLPELLPLVYRSNNKMAALIVRVMRQAACQQCQPLLESLQNTFLHFLDSEDGVFISVDRDIQRGLLETLYWVPDLNPDLLRGLVNMCHHNNVPTSEALYLLDIVHHRFQSLIGAEIHSDSSVAMTTCYLSFLLSVLTGRSRENQYGDKDEQIDRSSLQAWTFEWTNSEAFWQKHTAIVKRTSNLLLQVPDILSLSGVVLNFLKHLLESSYRLHITTVYSVYKCLSALQADTEHIQQSFVDLLGDVTLSLVVDKVAMVASSDHMTVLANQMFDCVIESLSAVPKLLAGYFHSAKQSIKDCDRERCEVIVQCLAQVLQNLPPTNTVSGLQGQLTNIQHSVKTRFPDLTDTQQWRDFLYSCTLLTSPS